MTLRQRDDRVEASINTVSSKIKDQRVANFVQKHWDDLQFEVAGASDTLVQGRDKVIKLLEVKLPKRIADEFVAEHGAEFRAAVERPFSFYHGFKSAKDWP